jgi:hypothetical protein
MVNYDSEINLLPNGEVLVTTKGNSFGSLNNIHLEDFQEETSYRYLSVDELRASLVREKFQIDILKRGGGWVPSLGIGLFATSVVDNNPFTRMIEISVGYSLVYYGALLKKHGEENKPQTDSRVKAFNETFPELKPVKFSPREYFSTMRLPFRR